MQNILLLFLILSSLNLSAQERNGLVPSQSKILTTSEDKKTYTSDLQSYIESVYTVSSEFYNNGALPIIEKGDFNVVLIDSNGSYHQKKSSYFKNIELKYIEEFRYDKSNKISALYGIFGKAFGIITIKIKDENL